MKKIEENKWLYALVYAITIIIMAIILFPLFDILLAKFFTHSTFEYSIKEHIISPIILGIFFGLIQLIIRKNPKKEEKVEEVKEEKKMAKKNTRRKNEKKKTNNSK